MIATIILAAGESRRMGQPKMLLPWGGTTVLGHVISVFQSAGVEDIIVVTGGHHTEVTSIVQRQNAHAVFNPQFSSGEMLSSMQCGLRTLAAENAEAEATFVALGDQPQIQVGTVQLLLDSYRARKSSLLVPSFRMRRGHPWLVERSLWEEVLAMTPPQSLRDFLNRNANDIQYVNVDNESILADLDTPEEYRRSRPEA